MSAALLDAVRFMAQWELAAPNFASSTKTEVILEWRSDTEKAIAAFDGSGRFGVAFVTDSLVGPASMDGVVEGRPPVELVRFVTNNESEIRRHKSWRVVEKEAP